MMSENKIFKCPNCPKEYKTNSGLWKHTKSGKCKGLEATEKTNTVSEPLDSDLSDSNTFDLPDPQEDAGSVSDTPEWLNYESPSQKVDDSGEQVTEPGIPTPLKFATKTATKPAKAFSKDTNRSLLMMIYGATDNVLSTYAKAVTAGEITSVVHSQEDKDFTADITLDWMESSDIDLTNHLTPGLLAFGVNAYYVGAPVARIQKDSKVEIGAEVGNIASRIPFVGKWLQNRAAKKRAKKLNNGLGQNPPQFGMEGEENAS